VLLRMAEDQERAARIAELKEQHPRLTWAKIAKEVGVSERAATRWQRTGALKPENAEGASAPLRRRLFHYIWTGPRPDTPDLFVDRRQEKPKQIEGPVDVRLDAVEGALAQILTAMSAQLGAQTDTLATMNATRSGR
jgi:hypothetical protein